MYWQQVVFAKVHFSYRTVGLVIFNMLSDRIGIYQTTLFWCEINKHLRQSFHQTTGLVSWLILPDQLFILPEMSSGLVTFGISEQIQHNLTLKDLEPGHVWASESLVEPVKSIYTGKPVLTDTRDRRTLAHNGHILVERIFSFIKSLKYFSI